MGRGHGHRTEGLGGPCTPLCAPPAPVSLATRSSFRSGGRCLGPVSVCLCGCPHSSKRRTWADLPALWLAWGLDLVGPAEPAGSREVVRVLGPCSGCPGPRVSDYSLRTTRSKAGQESPSQQRPSHPFLIRKEVSAQGRWACPWE